jgi:hypothetical protein
VTIDVDAAFAGIASPANAVAVIVKAVSNDNNFFFLSIKIFLSSLNALDIPIHYNIMNLLYNIYRYITTQKNSGKMSVF